MSFDRLQQMKDELSRRDPQESEGMKKALGWTAKETKVAHLGAGDTILGYKTEKYLLTGPMGQLEVHAAPSLELPPSYSEAAKLGGGMGPFSSFAEQFTAIKGMVLKQVSSLKMMGSVINSTSVATRVDRGPIAASRFEPPSGYKNVPPGI